MGMCWWRWLCTRMNDGGLAMVGVIRCCRKNEAIGLIRAVLWICRNTPLNCLLKIGGGHLIGKYLNARANSIRIGLKQLLTMMAPTTMKVGSILWSGVCHSQAPKACLTSWGVEDGSAHACPCQKCRAWQQMWNNPTLYSKL